MNTYNRSWSRTAFSLAVLVALLAALIPAPARAGYQPRKPRDRTSWWDGGRFTFNHKGLECQPGIYSSFLAPVTQAPGVKIGMVVCTGKARETWSEGWVYTISTPQQILLQGHHYHLDQ